MFGAFRSTNISLGGLLISKKWGLSPRQKARLMKRLRTVDSVIDTLSRSGVVIQALEYAKRMPKADELRPQEKYWVPSKRYPTGYKPISWQSHWTKTPHPRKWQPEVYHAPLVAADAPPAVVARQKNDLKFTRSK